MYDAEPGIKAALEATGEATVTERGFPGYGLLNDTHYTHDLAQLVQDTHPQLVIGMWSWDNAFAAAHPVRYTAIIERAIGVLLAPGDGVDGVAFLQFPTIGGLDAIIDPSERAKALATANADTRAWNRLVSTLPARYPGRVTFLRTASSLEVDGRYSAWLPTVTGGWIRARKIDNTHLCPAGAAVLGAAVTEQLTPMFHLAPPAPGWINDSWTSDKARYDNPPDGCPNDQP
jgi:hypothetical protein